MKTFVVRLWRKPWGKVFFAILYSLATILVYFGVALVLFAAFRTTIIPAIGQAPRQDASSDSQVSPEEMKRLTTYIPFIPSRPTNSTPQVLPLPPPQPSPLVTTEEVELTPQVNGPR